MRDLAPVKRAAREEMSNRIFFRLFQTANVLHAQGTKALTALGVTTHQWSVLGALSRPQAEAGMSVGELSRFLMVSRQNLSGVLARLERAGHVERVADRSDRRSRRVRLTPAGEALWAALEPLIHDFYDQALGGLSFDDRVDLLHYLNRLHGNMMKI